MTQTKKTKKGYFVEIKFTGYQDGKPFDSNISEDLKKINSEAKPEKTIIIIGKKMVVSGLDKALENKRIGEENKVHLTHEDAFGPRRRELVKTIPLKVFAQQKINPYPGQVLMLDNTLARVITVSGARVITDFNNPLAGKDLDYKFTISRIVTDEKEKCEAYFKYFFRTVPEFEIKENKVIAKGPKPMKELINLYKDKFKEIMKKDLSFEEKKEKEIESPKHSNS